MIERTTPMKSANIQSIFAAALVAMIVADLVEVVASVQELLRKIKDAVNFFHKSIYIARRLK